MKHSEEARLIEYFRELYEEFPNGLLIHGDSPDIIVDNEGYKVGIELTEIFQDAHLKKSKLKELEAFHSKIGNSLVKRIEELFNYKIVVHLGFNDIVTSKGKKIEDIVSKCIEASRDELLNLQISKGFNCTDPFLLPASIRRIAIFRFEESFDSYYGQNEGGVVNDLTFTHIKRTMDEKHKKVKLYKDCNEYWLVIKEGNYYAGTFRRMNIMVPIESRFDRVFLLRFKNGEVIRLK